MSDLISRIVEEREKRVEDLRLDLPIPTWDGALVGRFGILERKVVERFSGKKRGADSDIEFVLLSVRELYIRDPEGSQSGKRMEYAEEYARLETDQGIPITFNADLAELLGKSEELKTAVSVVTYCFKDNAVAIGGMAMKLITWMQNTDTEVADALTGE